MASLFERLTTRRWTRESESDFTFRGFIIFENNLQTDDVSWNWETLNGHRSNSGEGLEHWWEGIERNGYHPTRV